MSRVKKGLTKRRRHKKIIAMAKGYKWRRKNTFKAAKQAVMKALAYSYRDRRSKKRVFRRAWNDQINQASRVLGLSYSRLIHGLKLNKVQLDRKILARLCKDYPDTFAKLVELAKP